MSGINRLREATSPYLLQHADNPVDWWQWGAGALAEARRSGKPILLSIGYAACHWCHVMAHESFEDETTAALMNARFVNIKVDREERPDIDHLYMTALHGLGEQGGWPMTMFLLPDGRPFWGGTYFPPEPRWGRPSFRRVLEAMSSAVAAGDRSVLANADALAALLARAGQGREGEGIAGETIAAIAASLIAATDPVLGGLRGAPKFPNAPVFRFLVQSDLRAGGRAGREAAALMLRRMTLGGIHDHLGGGFARYSTDAEWLAPHFEKMLYDNAQLLELLVLAHADGPDPVLTDAAASIVGWLRRDMSVDTGHGPAFAASEDADSEGEEGRFYVWSAAEVAAALGPAAPDFARAYDVTERGNWEGKTILRRVTPPGTAEEEATLAAARETLLHVRARRPRPGRDDKVLTDWNALLVAALARAASVFDRPDWLALGAATYRAVRAIGTGADGRLIHAWRAGRIGARGLLDDHACLARAALALHEATGEPCYLADAVALAENAGRHFGDAAGYFATAGDADDVPLGPAARPRIVADGATPSGNGVIAEVFARLFHLTGDGVWHDRAMSILRAFSGEERLLPACPTLLAAADLLERGTTVVIAGDPTLPHARALASVALSQPDPAIMVIRDGTDLPPAHPAHGKTPGRNGASAYVCRRQTCAPPVDDPAALRALLAEV